MWGLLIAFLIGLAYGWMSPGKQDKSSMFWRGLLWGVGIALVITLLAWIFDFNPLGMGDAGFFSLVWSFVLAIAAFLVGVWIGDMVEGRRHGTEHGMRRV